MNFDQRIHKLKNGSDTAIWAAEEIERLRDAANVALGHLTGGMDGEWRDCNTIDLLRSALRHSKFGPQYQPKGGMCLVCKKRDENCSGLNFQEMPVIEKSTQFGHDVAIVKCTEYSRGRHLRDPH